MDALQDELHPAADAPPVRQPLIRSCLSCHARRVKCDKARPCASCVRANTECIYPTGKPTRRRRRKQNDSELLGRIKELEQAVDKLGTLTTTTTYDQTSTSKTTSESPATEDPASPTDLGKATLVVGRDTSQYLNGGFWVNISEEIADLKEAMQASDHDDSSDDGQSETLMHPTMHQAFVFGNSHISGAQLKQLRPASGQIMVLWEAFQQNVDAMLKVCHRPTLERLMMSAVSNPDGMTKPSEALFFAVCFGAVMSLDSADCVSLLGAEKDVLVKRCRIGTEQALARASFLSSSSLTSLSAFAIYILLLRCLDESKTVWSLGALAVQLAESLGLHRDGTMFGLKPFDVEMRRRLWWFILSQNRRSREDHGLEPDTLEEKSFDTKLPLNVNDDDLFPNMTDFPEPRVGFTDIFHTLFRCEVMIWAKAVLVKKDANGKPLDPDAIYAQGEEWMKEKYMRHCDPREPAQFIVYSIARLILIKCWLRFVLPGSLNAATDTYTSAADRERIFERSVQACEIWVAMISHTEAKRWHWLSPSFVQWQLVCYLLVEIPKRSDDPTTQRAWAAIDKAWSLPNIRPTQSSANVLWKALGLLWERAIKHKRALAAQRAARDHQRQLDLEAQLRHQGLAQQQPFAPFLAAGAAASFPPLDGVDMSIDYTQPDPNTGFVAEPLDFSASQDWGAIGALDPAGSDGLWAGDWQPSAGTLGEWDDVAMTGNFMTNENLW